MSQNSGSSCHCKWTTSVLEQTGTNTPQGIPILVPAGHKVTVEMNNVCIKYYIREIQSDFHGVLQPNNFTNPYILAAYLACARGG